MGHEYGHKTDLSRQSYERGKKVLIEGVNSPSRGDAFYKPYPIYIAKGEKGRLLDVDGNSYVDLMLGFSVNVLGYSHPKVVEVVSEVIKGGNHFACATEIEIIVAEKVIKMVPSIDKVRFFNTGTEATMMAVRLARAYTGKKKILKFEGHYHGWYDGLLANCHSRPIDTLGTKMDPVKIVEGSGIPQEHIENLIICPWNDLEIFEKTIKNHATQIAAVITEPIMSNNGAILPRPNYLENVQRICKENDILFILDEVVTGFRYSEGSYQKMTGLDPDITTFGKAFGLGFAASVVGGKEDIMQQMRWGKTLSYGTLNGARLPLAVANVNIDEMTKENFAGYKYIFELGEYLRRNSQRIFDEQGVPAIAQGLGPMFQFYFTEKRSINDVREYAQFVDIKKYQEFSRKLISKGLYVTVSNGLHQCSCLQHTHEDFQEAVGIIEETVKEMKKENLL